MSETIAAVVLVAAYALLWRHAIVKGRRRRADAARAARRARAVGLYRPARLSDIGGW